MMKDLIFQLVADELAEGEVPVSLTEGLGRMRLHLVRLETELARREGDQDAERLLQEMVGLAAVALVSASTHVLPSVGKEVA